jgi:hypothetical protein
MRRGIAWLAWFALLAGCAGTPDEPVTLPPGSTGSGMGAKQFYIEKVHPAFDLTCTWCHAAKEAGTEPPGNAPQWLSLSPETAYSNIEAYQGLIAHPENSLIILQGEHMGPALVPKQEQLVREWLMLEVEERNLPDPGAPTTSTGSGSNPPGLSAEDALNQFAACMTIDNYLATGMNLVPHQTTVGFGVCRGCHNTGWAGAFLDDDSQLTFDMNKQRPYLLKLVTADVQNGAFVDLVQSERFRMKGTEPCSYLLDMDPENDIYCHPKYILNPNVDQAVNDFFTVTYDAWKAGDCAAPMDGGGGGGGAGGAGGGAQ